MAIELTKKTNRTDKHWFYIVSIGLGLYLAYSEAYRYTALVYLPPSDLQSTLASFGTLCLFGILIVVRSSKKELRLYCNKVFLLFMGLFIFVRTLMTFTSVNAFFPSNSNMILDGVIQVLDLGLYIAYAEFFARLNFPDVVRGFSIALIISGTVQLLIAIVQPAPAVAILIGISILTAPLLFFGAKAQERFHQDPVYEKQSRKATAVASINNSPSWLSWSLWITFALITLLFGSIHDSWIPSQDMNMASQLIQVSAGIGTVLAGNIFYVLRYHLDDLLAVEFLKSIILPVAIGALYLATLVEGTSVSFYVILLNLATKAVHLLIWISPFVYFSKSRTINIFCISLVAFSLGKYSQMLLFSLFSGNPSFNILPVIAIVALAFLNAFSFLKLRSLSNNSKNTGELAFPACFNFACQRIIDDYGLTQREGEIFIYLAKGRSAEYIAEKFVISMTTVRTHTGHIYQKLNINSKDRLMDLVEERAEKVKQESLLQ